MKSVIFALSLIIVVNARFFDACPGRRISIGACLAGLCPAGSECVNGYCCKLKNNPETTTTPAGNSAEVENYEKCKNGKHAIGECISDNCPRGYKCEDGLCCKVGLPPVRVTMIPVELATTTQSTSESTNISTKSLKKGKSKSKIIPEAEGDEDEQQLPKKKNIKKLGSAEEQTETEVEKTKEETDETSTNEEDYGNELIVEDREEIEQYSSTTTTTTTTTPTPTSAISESSTKKKNAKKFKIKTTTTTSTTSQPIEEEEEDEDEEEEMEPITQQTKLSTSPKSIDTTSAAKTTTTTTKATAEEENISLTGCPVGESIGECISNECPEGHGCFQNKCCILTPQINCTDALSGCMSHLCHQRGYKEFMTKKCARTCARCHLVDLDTAEIRECRDRRTDCGEWAQEGFCESTLYTTRQKLKMCGKSCKLC